MAGLHPKEMYTDDGPLRQRKAIYRYAVPKVSLDAELLKVIYPGGPILDVGCGNGDLLLALWQRGARELLGIDLSLGMLKRARLAADGLRAEIAFQEGPAETLPFPDGSFDTIICKHVLQHVPDVMRAIREAHRVLRPGGTYLVSLNSRDTQPLIRQTCYAIAKRLGAHDYQEADKHLDLERCQPLLDPFPDVRLHRFDYELQLTEPEPLVDYIDSTRLSYARGCDDQEWQEILDGVRAQAQDEIAAKGMLVEPVTVGFFEATK